MESIKITKTKTKPKNKYINDKIYQTNILNKAYLKSA